MKKPINLDNKGSHTNSKTKFHDFSMTFRWKCIHFHDLLAAFLKTAVCD